MSLVGYMLTSGQDHDYKMGCFNAAVDFLLNSN
jgi:hypothetical protein